MFNFNIDEIHNNYGLPKWVKENLTSFISQKHVILEVILKNPSFENWHILGNKLFEKIILDNRYAWLLIDGAYSSLRLLQWAAAMSKESENNDSFETFFFKYLTYVQPHYTNNEQVVNSVEWTSFSKTNFFPMDNNLFNTIGQYDSIGCDVCIAAPKLAIDFKHDNLFINTNLNYICERIGSWLYPLEENSGFMFGLLEGQPKYLEVTQKDWLYKMLDSSN